MSGKCRPSLRKKTLANVMRSALSVTDKECVKAVFERFEGMVKVVRCRDCKLRETSDCPMYREEYSEWDDDGYTEVDLIVTDLTEDEGFCHCGAKMDGKECE